MSEEIQPLAKKFMDKIDIITNENRKLKHDLEFTRTLLDEMSKKAQQAEDEKNLAEYNCKKTVEKNEELTQAALKNIETTKKLCDGMQRSTETIANLTYQKQIDAAKIEELLSKQKELIHELLEERLRSLWLQTALNCIKDQIYDEESKERYLITIKTSETFQKSKDKLIEYAKTEANNNRSISGEDIYRSLAVLFAKEWAEIEKEFS